jgi:glycosyltransferase involved in cell wall biosynthesis
MKKVLVFKSFLLEESETFIKEQIKSYLRWEAQLVGLRDIQGLCLRGLNVRILKTANADWFQKRLWKILNLFDFWPPSEVRELHRERFSLLHAHFGLEAVLAWPLAKRLKIPMLVTLHGSDINTHRSFWESGGHGNYNRLYPRRLLRLAQKGVKFVAVSEAIRNKAISFGIPETSIGVKYIGINIKDFKPIEPTVSARSKRVLFVGRLVEKKGCEYLIRAFSQVMRNVPDAELVIGGDGPLRLSLERLAYDLGLSVVFTGKLKPSEVRSEMARARVFCLASVTAQDGDAEGLPIVLLEAQASGLPVITSALGGRTEGIIEGVTGFAFNERDVESLAQKIHLLLTDDILVETMSANAAAFVAERFDIGKCTRALEMHYDSIIEERQ